MAVIEIIAKIRDFLNTHEPVSEECHVVYMLVEIRKILEYKNCTQFAILKFYCDWAVHITKKRYGPIKGILDRIHDEWFDKNDIMISGRKKETVTFISHSNFKKEMEQFLKELVLPLGLMVPEN